MLTCCVCCVDAWMVFGSAQWGAGPASEPVSKDGVRSVQDQRRWHGESVRQKEKGGSQSDRERGRCGTLTSIVSYGVSFMFFFFRQHRQGSCTRYFGTYVLYLVQAGSSKKTANCVNDGCSSMPYLLECDICSIVLAVLNTRYTFLRRTE